MRAVERCVRFDASAQILRCSLSSLNDVTFVEAAGGLAQQMSEVEGTIESKLTYGFRLVLTRPPSVAELKRLLAFYETMQTEYSDDPSAATSLRNAAKTPKRNAALISVANVLLNLDETMVKP
jgi:hypothetical protein